MDEPVNWGNSGGRCPGCDGLAGSCACPRPTSRAPLDKTTEWATCGRCGKERQIDAPILPFASVCAACEHDMHRSQDACPEAVWFPEGFSMCRFGYHHKGRCEPQDTPESIRADCERLGLMDAP